MALDIGTFWLPENTEKIVTGKSLPDIERHPGVELYDELIIQDHQIMNGFQILKAADIINGIANGKEITLVDNSFAGSSVQYGLTLQTFRAAYVLNGKHYGSIDALMFSGIKFELLNLDKWFGITGFKRSYHAPITMTYNTPCE